MKIDIVDTKYEVLFTKNFNKQLKKVFRQGKDLEKLIDLIEKIANGEKLTSKYKDHALINNNIYKDCRECHIEPDWLLIYKYNNDKLILLMVATGSHSELFSKY